MLDIESSPGLIIFRIVILFCRKGINRSRIPKIDLKMFQVSIVKNNNKLYSGNGIVRITQMLLINLKRYKSSIIVVKNKIDKVFLIQISSAFINELI